MDGEEQAEYLESLKETPTEKAMGWIKQHQTGVLNSWEALNLGGVGLNTVGLVVHLSEGNIPMAVANGVLMGIQGGLALHREAVRQEHGI